MERAWSGLRDCASAVDATVLDVTDAACSL